MARCRVCGLVFASDEIGAHIISEHSPVERSRLGSAKRELKKTVLVLHRLEKQGLGLADYAQGLRLVANVLGVALDELESLQKEVSSVSSGLGDIELEREEG